MSTFNEIDTTCPECGEDYKGTIWTAIHAKEDPELKDLLLGGELNLLSCPKCSHVAYQDHFVLYQDPRAELVAYIYPSSQSGDENFLRKTMLKSFNDAQLIYKPKDRKDYEPVLIFGMDTFLEMMRQEGERAEQSQIAEAVCKENKIPFFVLRPSEARKLGTVRVMPGIKGDHVKVVKAFKELLKANPALDLYAQLAENLQQAASPRAL